MKLGLVAIILALFNSKENRFSCGVKEFEVSAPDLLDNVLSGENKTA